MIRRLLSVLALAPGLVAVPATARQKSIAPEQAPPAWLAYAGTVNTQVTAWLSGSEEAAQRLRAALDATRPAADQPTAPIALRLWIDRKGMIGHVEFASLGNAQADTDLHALLDGRPIGAVPPKGMLLPLRIAVALAPAPAPAPAPADAPPAPPASL